MLFATEDEAHALDLQRSARRSETLWYGLEQVPADLGPTAVTIGVFDGLHRGHRKLVDHARRLADQRGLPLVLVTFDPHPARVLGLAKDICALSTVEHRAELAGLAGADAVCVLRFTRQLASLSPGEFARRVVAGVLHAHAVVVGANFTFGARAAGDVTTLRELGEGLGFTAHAVPLLRPTGAAPCSSTYIRRCVRTGDLKAAARLLGRPYRVDGHRRGRQIVVAPDTALPPPGAYAATVDGCVTVVEVTCAGTLRPGDEVRASGRVAVTFDQPEAARV
ncbi:adenylyltransferase/cytidyltransferase family protein [Amycolatopsis sp. K13G38]|uniref:FAD synthase n=1 Tax=Amycolatopsis acididurans TaxID=2724524 RepID=A0ABX1IXU0_9PSEU|nr:adenylyltransferase/cytidyltransferase family protein [Amycolatopsis acididurans]NKQ52279.1 adenylyltransferase/cytidyltransferase family protein [Amycolatopsis acididurans]